jgi:hypothetical protein
MVFGRCRGTVRRDVTALDGPRSSALRFSPQAAALLQFDPMDRL